MRRAVHARCSVAVAANLDVGALRVQVPATVKRALNLKRLERYGQDVDARDFADTPELKRLYELCDANLDAGACGGCSMDWACHVTGREFGRTYVPDPKACTKRPPDPAGCAVKCRR